MKNVEMLPYRFRFATTYTNRKRFSTADTHTIVIYAVNGELTVDYLYNDDFLLRR